MATYLNRTLVLPPFFRHYTDRVSPEYTPFHAVFDPASLNARSFPSIPFSTFMEQRSPSSRVISPPPPRSTLAQLRTDGSCDGLLRRFRALFSNPNQEDHSLTFSSNRTFHDARFDSIENLTDSLAFTTHADLVVLACPLSAILATRKPWRRSFVQLRRSLRRARRVRDVGALFRKPVLARHGGYLAAHVRTGAQENERTRAHWKTKTKDERAVAKYVVEMARKLGLSAVFLATEEAGAKAPVVKALRDAFNGSVYTRREFSAHGILYPFEESVIEQEIAAEADYFVGTPGSSWSRFVLEERRVRGRPSSELHQDSILSMINEAADSPIVYKKS